LRSYPGVLEGLKKRTPADHPDKAQLEKARQTVKLLIQSISEKTNDMDRISQLLELNERLLGEHENLIDPARHFVRDGALLEVTDHGLQKRIVYLFNDLMVVAEKKGQNLLFKKMIDLTVGLVSAKGKKKNEYRFKVEDPDVSIEFASQTDVDRLNWITTIQDAIDRVADIKKSGYTLKVRQPKHVILDTGLKETHIVDPLLRQGNKILVINVDGHGREKWPNGVDSIKIAVSRTEDFHRVTLGATKIYLVMKSPFKEYPALLLKMVEHCFQPINYSTSFSKCKDGNEVVEVLILDRLTS
jgi:hypothetical protein